MRLGNLHMPRPRVDGTHVPIAAALDTITPQRFRNLDDDSRNLKNEFETNTKKNVADDDTDEKKSHKR